MKLSALQMRKIYKLSNDLGLDNEVLHSFVWSITKKESIKDLSIKEAIQVIKYLSGKNDERSTNPYLELMTDKQKGKILYLASLLGWTKEKSKQIDLKKLDAYVRKNYSTIEFFALSRSNAYKCIESFKAMLKRKKV